MCCEEPGELDPREGVLLGRSSRHYRKVWKESSRHMVVSVEDQADDCKNNRSCAVQDGSVVCVVATTIWIPLRLHQGSLQRSASCAER